MNRFFLSALALTFLAFATSASHAQNSAMGHLGQFLPQSGQDGPFRYTNTASMFEISNMSDPSAVQYFYAGPQNIQEGRRAIEASLRIDPNSRGSAGLLYGLSRDGNTYHALTLKADGLVTLFRRDGNGFRAMMEVSKQEAFQPGKENRLRIEENGDMIVYFLNGVQLGEIGGGLFGQGAVGIATEGAVQVSYSGFSVADKDLPRLPETGTSGQTQASADAGESVTFRKITVQDTAAPFGAMPAFETLLPEGWTTRGGIIWSPRNGCHAGPGLSWSATSPDGEYSIFFMPPVKWSWNNFGAMTIGCLNKDLPSTQDALLAYFESFGIQAQVLGSEQPDAFVPMAEAMRRSKVPVNLPGTREWMDWTVLKTSSVFQGRQSENVVIAVTFHGEMAAVDALNRNLITRFGNSAYIMALSTPAGKSDEGHPAFATIMGSMRFNPVWQQNVARWSQQYAAQQRQQLQQLATSLSNSGQSVSDMMFESWKRRNAASDAGHSRTMNSIMEVEPFLSSSGPVLLSQNYKYAWELDNGGIVMTNNPNYNPMTSLNEFGQQIEKMN